MKNPAITALMMLAGLIGSNLTPAAELPSPVTDADYHYLGKPDANKVKVGQMLFFDKIMSGNKNISCATCHHPFLQSGDGLSLGLGEKGQFTGPMRTFGPSSGGILAKVIGRNAPALFNLGAAQFIQLNWQGRHQVVDIATGVLSLPSGEFTPSGLDNVLAGQALFPILNNNEMLGQKNENEIITAPPIGTPKGPPQFPFSWDAYMQRLRGVPEYVSMFQAAFSDVTSADKITIKHYANALAAFQTVAFRADQSPFDRFLRGDTDAMSISQQRGMNLFYGAANCFSCHSGVFQTDHKFYAIAMPQFGPGVKSGLAERQEDAGRSEVTSQLSDKFKFRTPTLRNIAHTAPYGHTGAYNSLEAVIRHHLDPVTSFNNWDRNQVVMPYRPILNSQDFAIMDDLVKSQAIVTANNLTPISLSDDEIKDIIDYMHALTDPASLDMRHLIPAAVPSGLPVGD